MSVAEYFSLRDAKSAPEDPAAPLAWQSLLPLTRNRIGEFFGRRSDGSKFEVEVLIADFPSSSHARYIVNVLDVSHIKALERARREFVLNASHELRSTLGSVHLSLQFLTASGIVELPDKAASVVAIGERSSRRLISSINNLLDSEKLECGKLEMLFKKHNLSEVIDSATESVEELVSENATVLSVSVPEDISIMCDAKRISQAISNVITNAVRFSKPGATVEVNAQVDTKTNLLVISISDSGRGIPFKYQKLIFHRFQQVERVDRKKGPGLGLAICKGIIEAHGGSVSLTSSEGKGTTVKLSIPI